VKEGKKFQGPEQVRESATGCARIQGDTLGLVGLGTTSPQKTTAELKHVRPQPVIFFCPRRSERREKSQKKKEK